MSQLLSRIGGVTITTATPTEKIKENIRANLKNTVPEFRINEPVAIVGGGPSLKDNLDELSGFNNIIACGSVHDYLLKNYIKPHYAIICDPDPIMVKYIKPDYGILYLVASQCDPSVFKHLEGYEVMMWHLECQDPNIKLPYPEGTVTIGGGCTVGTRAMVMAMGMGFYNQHLFGMDTCLGRNDEQHAYEYQDPDYELPLVNDVRDVQFDVGGPIFRVAGYQLGQFFDFRNLCKHYAKQLNVTVHGDSLLGHYYQLAKNKQKEINNGNSNGSDGAGRESFLGSESIKYSIGGNSQRSKPSILY